MNRLPRIRVRTRGNQVSPVADLDRYRGGWLCPTKADRVRLTDMSPAVRRARLLSGLFAGLGVLAGVPWIGYAPLALFAISAGPLLAIDFWLSKTERPERVVAASMLLFTGLTLSGVAITDGVHSPMLPWVAIPVVTAAARFRLPVFLSFAVLATGGLVLAATIGSPHALVHDPAPVIGVVVMLAALVVAQQPLLDAEIRWRRDAVLDPLTGLLNRQGLARRFCEVAEQARVTGRPVSVVLFDLDEFKRLNDMHGHAQGDAVLKHIAYELRKALRSFELLYRIGGEEFLMILPGATLENACGLAELARGVIQTCLPAGLYTTASFGAASEYGAQIEFESMFDAADRAMYVAKRGGRNRVAYMPTGGPDVVIVERTAPLAVAG